MTTEIHPTQKAIEEAIDRIARTPDGAALYVFLQRRLMAVAVADLSGALRADHGERSFASKLIGLMATGIFESGGRTSNSGSGGPGDGEQPIVVPRPESVRVGGTARNPGGRRINEHTRVPGYDQDE